MADNNFGEVRRWAMSALKSSGGSKSRAQLKISADALMRGYDPTHKRIALAFRYLDEIGSR